MPYILTSQEWLAQSALLIEARPTTARVTTKYNIKPAKARAAKKAKKDGDEDTPMTDADAAATKPPRASLIIKTFDPHSGVCLKYKTTKAAEVSRLVQLLGSLGRKMAALPDIPAPVAAVEDEAAAGTAMPPVGGPGGAAGAGQATQQAQPGAGGGGGKGKKKKGKR
ncbi:putative signal recognition particle srp9 subunit [Diaporthe ampelina]|uniref:Putative signal recognition particle srp9 subunit n=1 Tax=Diaporthe ampelina TaxID=1214573 RepID=A0A0G2IFI9_9PEZI|nr:putative signal recognition particle srp9 subunit [Diaporthe ampelina]